MMNRPQKQVCVGDGRVAAFVLAAAAAAFGFSTAHPCLAQGLNYVWTGPPGARVPSGDWTDEGNWTPTRGFPNSFSETATIRLESTGAYEVGVDRDLEVMRLTLDAESATLLPTGILSGLAGRSIEFAPGGSLMLLRGRIEGNLNFLLQSGSAEIGPGLIVAEGGRPQGSPVIVARGTANSLTAASAELGSNSPAISLVADSADAQLTLQGAAAERQFRLLEGASIAIDAARGNAATLAAADRSGTIRVVNAGEVITGGTLSHEGATVLALELEQTSEGVLEVNSPTTLGVTRGGTLLVHRNHGNIVLHDTLTIAPFNLFINGEGGAIAGSGTIAAISPIANFGRFDPNVAVVGHLVNEATALLEFHLRGPAPGVDSDQLVVSGNVTLGGTLEIALDDGFSPQLNDTFQIISAGDVSGQFERILLPALPDDRAIYLLPSTTGFSLQITEPVPALFASTMPSVTLSQAFGGMPSQSNWTIDLANVSGDPQQVVAAESDTNIVHSIHVSGGAEPQATMTLHVQQNALLTASSAITVGTHGQLSLAGGAQAVAPSFDIVGGSLEGVGTLVGDVRNRGLVSPGIGASGDDSVGLLTIDGDFHQEADGVLEIDLLGPGPGEHDVIHVTGDISLAGNVLLDLSEFKPTRSFAIEIVDVDGVPITPEPECNVKGDGTCKVGTSNPLITCIVCIEYYLDGDFNQDGDVNRLDLMIWEDTAGKPLPPPPAFHGDADNDGDVDGDDLLALQVNFGKNATLQQAASVPEPGGLVLVLGCLGVLLSRAWQWGPATIRRICCFG